MTLRLATDNEFYAIVPHAVYILKHLLLELQH